jgi:O-antigen ligase
MVNELNGNSSIKQLTFLRNISFVSLIAILFLMPVYIWYVPPFMILWGISWIIENRIPKFKTLMNSRTAFLTFLLFLSFYLWQLVGIFYSPDKSVGWYYLFSRLSLFLFPLVLLIPVEKIVKNGLLLLRLFALSTTFFILSCFGFAFYESISLLNGKLIFLPHLPGEWWMNYFYSSQFSINQHPSYLALYVILSVFIALEAWFDLTLKTTRRIFWLLGASLLVVSVHFLSSRSGITVLILLLPAYLLIKLYRKLKFLIIGIIIIVTLLFVFLTVKTNIRLNDLYHGVRSGAIKKMALKDERIVIWNAALNPVRENLILGVGTGGVDLVMSKEYLKIGAKELLKGRYNIHNQYLEILLENGLIGLILFLAMIGYMIYISISQRNLLYGIFIITMLVFFIFETGLNRLQGVAFFSLFSFLFIHVNNPSGQKDL